MPSIRGAVEDAVITRLKRLPGGVGRNVRPFNGHFRGDETLDDIKSQIVTFPGVLVEAGESTFRPINVQKKRFLFDLNVNVIVAAESMRSRAEANRNAVAGGQLGAYELMEGIHAILAGADLELDHVGEVLEPRPDQQIYKDQQHTVWRMQFQVLCEQWFSQPETDEDLDSILTSLNMPVGQSQAGNPLVQASTATGG